MPIQVLFTPIMALYTQFAYKQNIYFYIYIMKIVKKEEENLQIYILCMYIKDITA